jgi:hypothetical protein
VVVVVGLTWKEKKLHYLRRMRITLRHHCQPKPFENTEVEF